MANQAQMLIKAAFQIDAAERSLDKLKAKFSEAANNISAPMVAANKKVTDGLASSASAMSKFGQLTANQRFIVRDISYQLSDMAVQLGNGTSFLRAFGQQVPQLLGPMGMFGAILGTVVAIGAPLAQALMGSSKEATTLAGAVDNLGKSVDAYKTFVDLSLAPTKELEARFGAATQKAIQFIDALQRVAQVKAAEDAQTVVSQMENAVGGLGNTTAAQIAGIGGVLPAGSANRIAAARGALGEAAKQAEQLDLKIQQMTGDWHLSYQGAQKVLEAVANLKNANGVDAQLTALLAFKNALDAAYPTVEAMPKALRDMYEKAADAGVKMAGFKGEADKAASGIANAADAASKLADELGRAMGNAVALANSAAFDKKLADLRYQYRGKPVAYAGAAEGLKFDQQQQAMYGANPDLPPEVLRLFAQRRAAAVADAEDKARADLKYADWQKSQSAGVKAGDAAVKGTAALFTSADNALAQQKLQIELIGKTGAEAAKLREEYALLAEAKRRNLDLDKVDVDTGRTLRQEIAAKAQAIGDLTQRAQDYTAAQQFMTQQQDALKQGFLDAIVSGKSFGSVLGQVAQQLEKAALQAAIFGDGPLASLFGGGSSGGSGSGGIFGGILKAIGFRASGGPVTAGQPYIVGEKQAELFVPNQNGTILPAVPKAASGGGASTSSLALRVYLDQNGNLQAQIAQIAGAISAQHIQVFTDKVLPAKISGQMSNGATYF